MDLDILSEITKYLVPIDIYKLSLTSKYYNKHINVDKYIIRELDTRLQNIFGDKLNYFKQLLISEDAIISGSFIIQCILGEIWSDSDIDLFIPDFTNQIFDEFLFNDIECTLKGNVYNTEYLSFGKTVDYETKSGQCVQLIKLNENKIDDFMNKNFDFKICKNLYDGKNLKIKDLYNIVNKIIDLEDVSVGQKIGDRCEKYSRRGFKLINKNLMDMNGVTIYSERKNTDYSLVSVAIMNKYPYTSKFMCGQNCIYKLLFGKHEHIGHWKSDFHDQAYGGDPLDAYYILLK